MRAMQCAIGLQHLPPAVWAGWLASDDLRASDAVDDEGLDGASAGGKQRLRRVLIIDDEPLIADTLARILNLSGFTAHAVYNGDEALAALDWHCPEIVLTDVRMPGRNGIETAVSIRAQCPHIRVVLFSGQAGTSELIERARRDGHGFELWPKPLHPRELIRRLQAL